MRRSIHPSARGRARPFPAHLGGAGGGGRAHCPPRGGTRPGWAAPCPRGGRGGAGQSGAPGLVHFFPEGVEGGALTWAGPLLLRGGRGGGLVHWRGRAGGVGRWPLSPQGPSPKIAEFFPLFSPSHGAAPQGMMASVPAPLLEKWKKGGFFLLFLIFQHRASFFTSRVRSLGSGVQPAEFPVPSLKPSSSCYRVFFPFLPTV